MPDPGTAVSVKLWQLVLGIASVLIAAATAGYRVLSDLISRIGGAHDHARQAAEKVQRDMEKQIAETQAEVQRIDSDVRDLRSRVATTDDLSGMEQRLSAQISEVREDARARDARLDRVAERTGRDSQR
jgi:peptidoglycan hydrolase CwlO-like protein